MLFLVLTEILKLGLQELIVIKKIKAIKNFNENMTKRQQSFISVIFKIWLHLSNTTNKLI